MNILGKYPASTPIYYPTASRRVQVQVPRCIRRPWRARTGTSTRSRRLRDPSSCLLVGSRKHFQQAALKKLQKDGNIEKVDFPTDWISATVVAKKSNRDIRLCLDSKPLNKVLKRCKYPLPVIEEVLPELGNAKVFIKVDCVAYASRAVTTTERKYAQIEKEILAIVFGAERYH